MKHLLILLISILLLSSPQFGQSKETGVLYIWENGTSIWVNGKMGKNMVEEHSLMGKGKGKETSM